MDNDENNEESQDNGTRFRSGAEPALLGQRLRSARERKGGSLRSLAKQVGVSASLISQVENGKVMPSVGTLYAIVSELGLSMDELFSGEANGREARPDEPGPVQRSETRKTMFLASGVRWERLTTHPVKDFEFQYAAYGVGAESCPEDALMQHGGQEYGYVLEGRLGLTVGYESYELEPGDSVSFSSHTPHRLWNAGDEPAAAIWMVVGRQSDDRVGD